MKRNLGLLLLVVLFVACTDAKNKKGARISMPDHNSGVQLTESDLVISDEEDAAGIVDGVEESVLENDFIIVLEEDEDENTVEIKNEVIEIEDIKVNEVTVEEISEKESDVTIQIEEETSADVRNRINCESINDEFFEFAQMSNGDYRLNLLNENGSVTHIFSRDDISVRKYYPYTEVTFNQGSLLFENKVLYEMSSSQLKKAADSKESYWKVHPTGTIKGLNIRNSKDLICKSSTMHF